MLGKRQKLGAMSEPAETSLWTKAKRADLPISLNYALIFLGLWFILLPAGLALGVWYFYGFGLVLTVVVGLLTRRYYRQVTLDQGEGYSVIRLEYLRGSTELGQDLRQQATPSSSENPALGRNQRPLSASESAAPDGTALSSRRTVLASKLSAKRPREPAARSRVASNEYFGWPAGSPTPRSRDVTWLMNDLLAADAPAIRDDTTDETRAKWMRSWQRPVSPVSSAYPRAKAREGASSPMEIRDEALIAEQRMLRVGSG